jgi:hypothetical protein
MYVKILNRTVLRVLVSEILFYSQQFYFIANMTLQQQQQSGVVLGADRSIMPVVSVSGVGIGVATASQMNAVPQSPLSTVQQLPLPVCFYIILQIIIPKFLSLYIRACACAYVCMYV